VIHPAGSRPDSPDSTLDTDVDNTGVHPGQAVLETTDERFDFVLNLNLRCGRARIT
jgi:hypothetical protein